MSKTCKINLKSNDIVEVLLYDEIGADSFFGGGISAKTFREQIKGIKSRTINLRINSPGGSVTEGAAMLSALDEFPGRIEVDIDGLAASAATFVMMAGDVIRAASNALVMIHNPYGGVMGGAEDMRRTADLLDKVTEQILDTYARKSSLTRDQLRAAMAAETWWTGQEAAEVGFVDKVTEQVNAAAFVSVRPLLARMKFKNTPELPSDAEAWAETERRRAIAASL